MNSTERINRSDPYTLMVANTNEEENNHYCRRSDGWSPWHADDFLFKLIEVDPDPNRRTDDVAKREYILINYGLWKAGIRPRDPNDPSRELPDSYPGQITEGWYIGSQTSGWGYEFAFFGPNDNQTWRSYRKFNKATSRSDDTSVRIMLDGDIVDDVKGVKRMSNKNVSMKVRSSRYSTPAEVWMYYVDVGRYKSAPQDCHQFEIMYGPGSTRSHPCRQYRSGGTTECPAFKTTFDFEMVTPVDPDLDYILSGNPGQNYYGCYLDCCHTEDFSDPDVSQSCMQYVNETFNPDSAAIYGYQQESSRINYDFYRDICVNRPGELDSSMNILSSNACMTLYGSEVGNQHMIEEMQEMCENVNPSVLDRTNSRDRKLLNMCACYHSEEEFDNIKNRIRNAITDTSVRQFFDLQLSNPAYANNPGCWYRDCEYSDYRAIADCPQTTIIACWQTILLPDGTDGIDKDINQICNINLNVCDPNSPNRPPICDSLNMEAVQDGIIQASQISVNFVDDPDLPAMQLVRVRRQSNPSTSLYIPWIIVIVGLIILLAIFNSRRV